MYHRHCRSDVRFHIQRRCQFTCAVFGDEILDWDSFDGLSSAMVLPPVGVNKKQFIGISNLGKAQTKPTFRKSPSGFSFPLQVLSIGILRLRPRSPGATIQSAKFRSRIFNDVAAMSQKISLIVDDELFVRKYTSSVLPATALRPLKRLM